MDHAEVRSTLAARLASNWTATPIAWPNYDFDPSRLSADEQTTGFIRFSIQFGASEQIGLGGELDKRQWRNLGVLFIQVFVAENSGTKLCMQHVDALKELWRGQQLAGGILIRSPDINVIGRDNEGFFQVNVSVAFQWDEFT